MRIGTKCYEHITITKGGEIVAKIMEAADDKTVLHSVSRNVYRFSKEIHVPFFARSVSKSAEAAYDTKAGRSGSPPAQ